MTQKELITQQNHLLCVIVEWLSIPEEIFCLQKLSLTLQPWFIKLGVVYDVFYHGTEEGRAKGDNSVLAAKLLSRLYNTVLKYDGFSEESSDLVNDLRHTL